MNLSFLRYFKKDKDQTGGVAVAPPPVVPIDKPASERFGKTVMPTSSRVTAAEPIRDFPVASPTAVPTPAAPAPTPPRKISLGGGSSDSISLTAKKNAATGNPLGSERTIALPLADLVSHLPADLVRANTIDLDQRILFRAADLERGMATGRPTVLLRSIFQQAPDLFISDVGETDAREVALPIEKVLEQFSACQIRPDQVTDAAVPQVETPFLKMTEEDSERFGKTAAPIPAAPRADAPAPNPAHDSANAPSPEIPKPIRPKFSLPNESANAVPPPAPAPAAKKISPNGAGASATERVPASSGPPVPTRLPSPLAPPPMRIPFKVTPPSNDLRVPAPNAPPPKPVAAFNADSPRVRLPLRNVLRGVSPFQLSGPIDTVPETAAIEIPFSIIEPQLSLGRIAIAPAQFQAALPEEYRSLLKIEEAEVPIPLPLQDVLQNLPNESLKLRGDQLETEVAHVFETPFSAKAAEDAERLKISAAPVAKANSVAAPNDAAPTEKPAPLSRPKISLTAASFELKTAPPIATPAERNALQRLLNTDETLDAKSVAAHIRQQSGVSACAVVFSDGLNLTSNIPASHSAACALAPSILKRIDEHIAGANLGALQGMTLFCHEKTVSFFPHENLCLAVLHSNGEIAAEVRGRLASIVRELSQIYAPQPNA